MTRKLVSFLLCLTMLMSAMSFALAEEPLTASVAGFSNSKRSPPLR